MGSTILVHLIHLNSVWVNWSLRTFLFSDDVLYILDLRELFVTNLVTICFLSNRKPFLFFLQPSWSSSCSGFQLHWSVINMRRASGQSICSSDFCFMFEPSALAHNCFLASEMIDDWLSSFSLSVCVCVFREGAVEPGPLLSEKIVKKIVIWQVWPHMCN